LILAVALKEEGNGNAFIYMISGIFKDKAFIKEAMQKTGARLFFAKTLDLGEFIDTLSESLESLIEDPVAPIFEILTKPQATQREVRKAIESLEMVGRQ